MRLSAAVCYMLLVPVMTFYSNSWCIIMDFPDIITWLPFFVLAGIQRIHVVFLWMVEALQFVSKVCVHWTQFFGNGTLVIYGVVFICRCEVVVVRVDSFSMFGYRQCHFIRVPLCFRPWCRGCRWVTIDGRWCQSLGMAWLLIRGSLRWLVQIWQDFIRSTSRFRIWFGGSDRARLWCLLLGGDLATFFVGVVSVV